MAKKKITRRGSGRRRSQSGGAGPEGGTPEQQHDEAMRVLRAEYYQGVRDIVRELDERLKNKDIDDWNDAIHQAVDGSYWVIYTHANFQVLMCSDNHNAYVEDFGEPPVEGGEINWAALAFGAMYRDVQEQLEAEGVGPDGETEFEEAPRGRMERETRGPRGLRRR
jgi:hypothetical protein